MKANLIFFLAIFIISALFIGHFRLTFSPFSVSFLYWHRTSTIPIRCEYEYDSLLENQLNSMLLAIFGFAKHLNIDLIWYVEQKMRYNELRENKHGKKY